MMFTWCDKFLKKGLSIPNKRLFGNYNFSCFEDINHIAEVEWERALNGANLFLSYNYLKALQLQQTDAFRFRYVLVYNRKNPIGVIYFQINDFSASLFGELVESQINDLKNHRSSVFQKYIEKNKNETVMRLVTCGNNFISGEHGFYLNINHRKTRFKLLEEVIDCVSRVEKLRGKISAVLVKDFYEETFVNKDCWYCPKFIHFNGEPNMIVQIPEGLSKLDDYLAMFSKKYRNRAKGILKAGAPLVKKRLTIEDLIEHKQSIYKLYTNVFLQAKFKLAHVSENYFLDVMQQLPQQFYMDAWFLNGKMVSFAGGFYLKNEIEAHYVGFDYEINKEYDLYQNILYSYLETAILANKQRLNLGRTASEIKSTIGAKAHELICYIRPQNTVSKLILKPFIQFLQPTQWIPRNPFKEGE